MTWLDSTGGPLIVLSEEMLNKWAGCDGPGKASTDYDRACSVQNLSGKIKVGSRSALVLSDEPLSTTWLPSNGSRQGTIVRWVYGPSKEEVEELLFKLTESIPTKEQYCPEERLELSFDSENQWIWDSAFPGKDKTAETLGFQIEPGRYKVQTYIREFGSEIRLIFHQLERDK